MFLKKFSHLGKNMPNIEDIDLCNFEDGASKLFRLQKIRQEYRQRLETEAAQRNAVLSGLKEIYPQLDNQDLIKLSYAVVLMPTEKQIIVEKKKVKVADLQFMTAESIENISSGTNSRQEYFSWFEDCAEIMTKMNDGYVSDTDLELRNDWIDNSYVREAEIMACLALYKSSSYYLAEERYNLLYNKLVKLRQIRSAIIESTKSASDEEKSERIKRHINEKVQKYLAAMALFAKNSPMWNLSKNELKKLGMYHGDDYDLAQEYAYFYSLYEHHDDVSKHCANGRELGHKVYAENALPVRTAEQGSVAFSDTNLQKNILPQHQYSALPAHKNVEFSEKKEILALPAHNQYDFDADLKYNFMQCLNRRYFEMQSYAEEMRLASRPENKEQVKERIWLLRERYKKGCTSKKEVFNTLKYRELLKNSNML